MIEVNTVVSDKSLNISKLNITLETAEMFAMNYTVKGYAGSGTTQMFIVPLKVDLPFDAEHLKELALKQLGLKESTVTEEVPAEEAPAPKKKAAKKKAAPKVGEDPSE